MLSGAGCHARVANEPQSSGARPVRVALVVGTDAFDRFGRVLRHLAVGLIDQAVHVRVLSPDPRVSSLSLGPIQTVMHQPLVWPRAKRRFAQLEEVCAHDPPQVIHAMSAESYAGARRLADAFDADLILHVSSIDDCEKIVDADRRGATRFVATSRPLHAHLESRVEAAADRISTIRPGVLARSEITCFTHGDRMSTILCTARFEPGTGIDELIEAVATLRKQGRGLLLFLIGKGRHDSALRRMVRERKLSACVTIADAPSATDSALESADIYVSPTEGSRFTVGGLQAMAAGVAVVTPPNPACDHYIDGETCVVSPDASTASLVDAIERLLSDRQAAQRLARSGLEFVRNNHSISAMADQLAGLYRKTTLARSTIKMHN